MTDACRIDAHGTVHSADVRAGQVARGGYDPGRRSLVCGCRVAVHRFRCVTCTRVVGWCMGCDDALPAVCDDCWAAADRTWRRLSSTRRWVLGHIALRVREIAGDVDAVTQIVKDAAFRPTQLRGMQKAGLIETQAHREHRGVPKQVQIRLTPRGRDTILQGWRAQADEASRAA